MISFILASLLLPAFVAGQDYGGAPAATTTSVAIPSATPGQHIVVVGQGDQLKFNPPTVTANQGENVTFVFDSTFQHSVTESTFDNPCTYNGGFNSGLQSAGSQFTLTITNASAPIWLYCMQTNPLKHCGMGMVGAVNPPSSGNTFDSYQAKANSIGNNEGAQTATPALSGPAATATGPATGGSSSATQLTIGAGAVLAGIAASLYTLA